MLFKGDALTRYKSRIYGCLTLSKSDGTEYAIAARFAIVAATSSGKRVR